MDLLERLREDPARAAILLDVDGTLAPIVPRPEDARVPEETRDVLRGLVRRYALVGAVSGRPGRDAAAMLGIPEVVVAGTHGLELEDVDPVWVERMRELARGSRFRIEDKGVALALHFRDAGDEAAARAELEALAARAQAAGLKARFGRKVLELLPPIEADKGTAVRKLLARAGVGRALYAGDDTTDLDAFAALDGLEVGVKVAVASNEGPAELRERADVVVDGTEALAVLLRRL